MTEIMTNQNTVYSMYTLYIPCTDWTFLQYMFKSHTGKFYDCKTKTTLQHKSIGECRSVISYKLLAMTAHKLIKTLSKIRCSGSVISYKLLAMTAHKLIKTLSKIRCSGSVISYKLLAMTAHKL